MEVYSLTPADDAPATVVVPGQTGLPAITRTPAQVQDERNELAVALMSRCDDILHTCQARAVAQADPGMTWELAARHPLWDIVTVAVSAIAHWLETGTGASAPARRRIDSLGNAAAVDQETAIAARASESPAPGPVLPVDGGQPSGVLSVALVTKLNLWWKDATCRVLEEESARLGTDPATLRAAEDMVERSCNSSMVRMAKQYDLELQELHAQLLELATHDQLTGLANRTVFLSRLETAIARLERHPGGLAVMFIDLDDFKAVNDAFGHTSGDELLTALAGRFSTEMRPEDTVARFGGDEFVALFQDLTNPTVEALALAERLHRVIAEPIVVGGEPLYITASIGVAVVTDVSYRSEEVLAQADITMYGVKRSGRNRVAVVELGSGMHPTAFAMASELHRALEDDGLTLAYQPAFDARSGDLVGFEALCRWDHPERGVISPGDFIPIAEEAGLMTELGSWVLTEATRQLAVWTAVGDRPLTMAINVSGRQLADPAFPALVQRTLTRFGIRPDQVVLEITESVLLGEHASYESVLTRLNEVGVRLAIDDFGTGYSSLAYLRRFRVNQLKVDRGFVQDVAAHGDTRIMSAVVRLAHDLDLEVVAEGVETETERRVVQKLGCDVMQGFLLGYPLAAHVAGERFFGEGSRGSAPA
jgi:diguanylate cyclase (GGDEF)-like protein